MFGCGFAETTEFQKQLEEYRTGQKRGNVNE